MSIIVLIQYVHIYISGCNISTFSSFLYSSIVGLLVSKENEDFGWQVLIHPEDKDNNSPRPDILNVSEAIFNGTKRKTRNIRLGIWDVRSFIRK